MPQPSDALPTVSAIVLAWQSEPWLRRCVAALLASEKVAVDVVLVDNGCTDDDVEVLAKLDGVKVVRPGRNLGYSPGNNAGVAASTGEYVALINGDAVVEPGTLARLVEELDRPPVRAHGDRGRAGGPPEEPSHHDDNRRPTGKGGDPSPHPEMGAVGIAMASVRLAEDPRLLNSNGNMVHVLGISWVGGLGEPETRTVPTDVAGAMGAGTVTTRAHWDRLGGFCEHYFAYHEDADLSIRTWRLGLRVVNVPDAVLVHRYEFSRNSNKYYLVERNRLFFVLTLWSWRALLLLGPAMLALEVAMLALAVKEGWAKDKVRGWMWLWRNRKDLARRRKEARAAQTVPDRVWMEVLTTRLDTPLIDVPKIVLRPLNAATTAYWKLIRRFV